MGLKCQTIHKFNENYSFPFLVFLLFVFSLPFYNFRIFNLSFGSISNASVNLSDILLAVLLLLLIIRFFSRIELSFPRRLSPLVVVTLFFVIYLFITELWSSSFYSWAYYFIRMSESMLVLLLPMLLVKSKAHLKATVYVFSSSLFLFLIDTFIRLFKLIRNIPLLKQNYWLIYAQFKQSFLVKDTNTVSLYIVLVFVFLVYLYSFDKRKILKILIMLSVFIFTLTLSREAFIATLVSSLVLLPFVRSKVIKRVLLYVIFFFASLIILSFVVKQFIRQDSINFLLDRYLGTIFFIAEEGFKQRINFFKYAYSIFQTSPITGIGLGSYLESGFTFFHNLFITLALSTGLIGFILFFLLIILVAINMSSKRKSILGELGIWTLFVYLIQGFAMFDLTEVYFWMYLGIITIGMEFEKYVEIQN